MQESTVPYKVSDPFLVAALYYIETQFEQRIKDTDTFYELTMLLRNAWSFTYPSDYTRPDNLELYFRDLTTKEQNDLKIIPSQVKISTMMKVMNIIKLITIYENIR